MITQSETKDGLNFHVFLTVRELEELPAASLFWIRQGMQIIKDVYDDLAEDRVPVIPWGGVAKIKPSGD